MYRLTQSYIPQAKHKIELERCRAEVDVVQKAKEEEMEEVHKRCDLVLAYIFWMSVCIGNCFRVKQAIVKKEEVMTQLREQHQAALKRADHLEGLLEQQRKQLLVSKK